MLHENIFSILNGYCITANYTRYPKFRALEIDQIGLVHWMELLKFHQQHRQDSQHIFL